MVWTSYSLRWVKAYTEDSLLGLSQRANHPREQLHLLHGSLFDIKCTSFYCNYSRDNDFTDPIVPALGIPQNDSFPASSSTDKTGEEATKSLPGAMAQTSAGKQSGLTNEIDISDASNPIPNLTPDDLPKCPKCNGLLRPGVVWFGEPLPRDSIDYIDKWIESEPVDLMLVIGTSSRVYPAAEYVDTAREHGARVAVINIDPNDLAGRRSQGLTKRDWFFQGDANVIVPEILKTVIGDI